MKKQKKVKRGKGIIFWSPIKIGEKLSGKFIRFEKSAMFDTLVLVLDTKKVSISVVLKDFLAAIYNKLKIGDVLEITFTGKQKRTKIYSMKWNGKEVQRAGGSFGDPATSKNVKEFFTTPLD